MAGLAGSAVKGRHNKGWMRIWVKVLCVDLEKRQAKEGGRALVGADLAGDEWGIPGMMASHGLLGCCCSHEEESELPPCLSARGSDCDGLGLRQGKEEKGGW